MKITPTPCATRVVFAVAFTCACLSADAGVDNSNEYQKGSLLVSETQVAGQGRKSPVPGRKQVPRVQDEIELDTKFYSANDDPPEDDEEDCD